MRQQTNDASEAVHVTPPAHSLASYRIPLARACFVWVQSRAFFAQDVRRVTIQKAIMKLTSDGLNGDEEERRRKSFLPAILTQQKIESRGQIKERAMPFHDEVGRARWLARRDETRRGKYKSNPSRQKAKAVKYGLAWHGLPNSR